MKRRYVLPTVRPAWRERLLDWGLAIALGVAMAASTVSWWTS